MVSTANQKQRISKNYEIAFPSGFPKCKKSWGKLADGFIRLSRAIV